MDAQTRPAGQPPAGVPYLTVEERVAAGEAARGETPRSSHAALELPAGRDPIALLEAQAASRIQELVPIRYGRMLVSPLAVFRGAATVMAHDLAGVPRTGLQVQLSGDAHLLNFGGFASPERDLVFDLNDFDETLPGPFEWDVKRLAASVEVAARERELDAEARQRMVVGAARTYRRAMRSFARMTNLNVWYSRLDAQSLVAELERQRDRRGVRELDRVNQRARSHDSARALAKLTREVDGEPRIISDPPRIVPISELVDGSVSTDKLEAQLGSLFRSYRRSLARDRRTLLEGFRYGELAQKVVGIGSVGTQAWILLLLGRDDQDPLFLQIKEAQPSVLEPILGPSRLGGNGRRVVDGQRLMQSATDIFLGWIHAEAGGRPGDYYVRQLWDWKISAVLDELRPRGLELYAGWCAWTLARAHARSGDRIAIAAYLGKSDTFDRAIAEFAAAYADVNERDHAALAAAVDHGHLHAAPDV
jgi:uncharacterized protein (DUF2252 family)